MHEDEKSRRISPVLIFNEFQNRPFTEGRRCIRGGVLKIHAPSQTATCLSSALARRARLWPKRQPISHVRHHNVLNRRTLSLGVARILRLRGFSVAIAAHARFFGAAG
jgi:hypothetical protein